MSAIKLRMSQVSRLISRDYRDVASFIAFMIKRFPTSIVDRVQGAFHLRKRIPGFHPNCIENSKSPILEIDSLYLYGKKLYNGNPARFLNSETFVYWPPDWNGGDLRNWGTGLSQGIRYYGKGITDDIKTTWEVHRLQWVPSLAFVANRDKDSTLADEILDQISFFLNAKVVLAPYGSGLANIVFCNPGTKVYEIGPNSSHPYDQILSKRYENLCKICNLNYHKFLCDSVDVKNHDQITKKHIHQSMLKDSNFYKNMILKLSDVDLILKEIQHPTDE